MIEFNVEADGIEDLVNEILETANATEDVDSLLTVLASDILSEMRRGRFNDGPNANLRRSMRTLVYDHTLVIRMLYYGYYLSFGTRDGSKSPLTEEVASVFDGKEVGSFFNQPDNNAGIAARGFYPEDIQELIANRLEAIALQNLEQ